MPGGHAHNLSNRLNRIMGKKIPGRDRKWNTRQTFEGTTSPVGQQLEAWRYVLQQIGWRQRVPVESSNPEIRQSR